MIVVKIIRDWFEPNIFRQTPNSLGIWEGVKFIENIEEESDYVVVLNKLNEPFEVFVNKNNVWAVMQEPYIKHSHEWMISQHFQYSKIFSHHVFNKKKKYIPSQPLLPWYVNKSFDELILMEIPEKSFLLSCISSNKSFFPGHLSRLNFIEKILKSNLKVDFFGSGFNFIDDKWDGLAPYKYSIVIENSSSNDYWTEKLTDSFLSFTMPIYFGCKNLELYFPAASFVKIDINDFENSLSIINETINNNTWENSINLIIEARNKILNEYQFFPFVVNQIKKDVNSRKLKKSRFSLLPFYKSRKTLYFNRVLNFFKYFG